jgi:hypothetical protein
MEYTVRVFTNGDQTEHTDTEYATMGEAFAQIYVGELPLSLDPDAPPTRIEPRDFAIAKDLTVIHSNCPELCEKPL